MTRPERRLEINAISPDLNRSFPVPVARITLAANGWQREPAHRGGHQNG